jgi:hypothetical protein
MALRNEAHELLNLFLHEPNSILAEHFVNKIKVCIDEDYEGYLQLLKSQVKNLYGMYKEVDNQKRECMKKVDILASKVDEQAERIRILEIQLLHAKIEQRKAPTLK